MPETSRRPVAIENVLAEHGRLVENALDRYLPAEAAPPAEVHRAMRYSVFAGGKRLRPMLVIAGAEVAGAPLETVLPSACAVELIHTYSLIHDDLPAMDDSDIRRGRPTCHVVFGEAMAVLAGDALHAHAFELLARNAEVPGCSPARVVRAIRELTLGIGSEGMVGGQVFDLLAVRAVPADRPAADPRATMKPHPEEAEVRQIHRLKTGALIRACLKIGGVLAGANDADLLTLDRYGEHMGVAFQIVDDILDVVGERGKLGKDTGTDASHAKVTFPAVFGLERSRRLAADATREAVRALAPLGARGARLEELAIYLLERDR
ncbi:MAG TPA: farnesyl diphosphate synthase [bacterium]|nr:farnesyl diphosphate synthase [bacterium]